MCCATSKIVPRAWASAEPEEHEEHRMPSRNAQLSRKLGLRRTKPPASPLELLEEP